MEDLSHTRLKYHSAFKPKIEDVEGGVRVTFQRNNTINSQIGNQTTTRKGIQKSIQKGIQKSLQKTLSLIVDNPHITSQQIADKIGITRVGVAKQLKKLQDQGVIHRVGPAKGGYWEVTERKEL